MMHSLREFSLAVRLVCRVKYLNAVLFMPQRNQFLPLASLLCGRY